MSKDFELAKEVFATQALVTYIIALMDEEKQKVLLSLVQSAADSMPKASSPEIAQFAKETHEHALSMVKEAMAS